MELKDRLKQARKARKMSQVKLSEASGLDQTTSWILLLFGAALFPVGVIHGVMVWLGFG